MLGFSAGAQSYLILNNLQVLSTFAIRMNSLASVNQ